MKRKVLQKKNYIFIISVVVGGVAAAYNEFIIQFSFFIIIKCCHCTAVPIIVYSAIYMILEYHRLDSLIGNLFTPEGHSKRNPSRTL